MESYHLNLHNLHGVLDNSDAHDILAIVAAMHRERLLRTLQCGNRFALLTPISLQPHQPPSCQILFNCEAYMSVFNHWWHCWWLFDIGKWTLLQCYVLF